MSIIIVHLKDLEICCTNFKLVKKELVILMTSDQMKNNNKNLMRKLKIMIFSNSIIMTNSIQPNNLRAVTFINQRWMISWAEHTLWILMSHLEIINFIAKDTYTRSHLKDNLY